jgi:serine/threonine protein kinase/formylglycine-generating enzyme required for sulfatase activity
MAEGFRADLRDRLPLPLARLYRRAFNAKARIDRHHNAFYLLEATIKAAAAAQIAAYVAGGARDPTLDRRLAHLALPSIGHWVAFLREVSAATARLDPHPFPDIAGVAALLAQPRDNLPAVAACTAAMSGRSGGKVRPLDFIDSVPAYRNRVFGHGGMRDEPYYAEMGDVLLTAAVEFLDKVPLLGGAVLAYVAEVAQTPSGKRSVDLWDLTGTDALRAHAGEGEGGLRAGHLYLRRQETFLDLHPLLVCAHGGPEEGVLFLNRSQVEKRVEYLDYVTGETSPAPGLLEDHRRILGRLLGAEVTPERLAALQDGSLSDQPEPEPAPLPASARRFGEFDLLSKLGEGAMGTVYLARQRSLGRLVALKMMPPALSGDDIAAARFSREVQALARSDHPHVVRILASGRTEGLHWYAMEYVDGCDLREVAGAMRATSTRDLDAAVSTVSERKRNEMAEAFPGLPAAPRPRPPSPADPHRRLAEVFRDAATGLHHLHERGVIHRDVKPANLMVTPEGRAVVMDLGLAKLAGEASFTRPESVLGTIAYAAPEQVAHAVTKVDTRADVYGLGATLYELSTGRPPYVAATTEALVAMVLRETPPPPRKADRAVPKDLDAVIRKAMERDPDRRYPTAAALAQDLGRFAAGTPVSARPPGLGHLFRLWVRRNKAVAATAFGAFAIIVVGTLLFLRSLTEQRDAARDARDRATAAREEATKERDEKGKALDEKARALDEVLRLADSKKVKDLVAEEESLWPAHPDKAPAMAQWLDRAKAVLKNRPDHEAALARVRERAKPYTEEERKRDHAQEIERLAAIQAELEKPAEATEDDAKRKQIEERRKALEEEVSKLEARIAERGSWAFEGEEDDWRHQVLTDLIKGLDSLAAALAKVEKRHGFAITLGARSIDDRKAEWDATIEAIAASPRYGGLKLVPQLGLVPLGPDPGSGLFEFAHLGSGEIPARDAATRRLVFAEDSAIVLVLIPGGTFRMGAQKADANGPNFDPQAEDNLGPVHEVKLSPHFLGKHEVTQAQWERMTGERPSSYGPGDEFGGKKVTHPVERVSWEDCARWLGRWNLALPTEAQWENGCRTGTDTPWWCGKEARSLEKAANVADAFCKANGGPASWNYEAWDDGYTAHAPVGSFAANGFGLHDVHGNVWEWCRDTWGRYAPDAATDPLRQGAGIRVNRGGSWSNVASNARSALRSSNAPGIRGHYLGARPARTVTSR